MEGVIGIRPEIQKISFTRRGMMDIHLRDGRIIIVPLALFPHIKNLNEEKRKRWYIINKQMFSFDDCSEIYHIEQVLGKEKEYSYLKTG
jgi:hypothetical protein